MRDIQRLVSSESRRSPTFDQGLLASE